MKKFLSIIGNIFLWCGAVLGLLTITVSILSTAGVVKPLIVVTGSMSPTFEAGSFIISVDRPASETEVGDIVTVPRSDGVSVTHRVVDVENFLDTDKRLLTLKGDANDEKDFEPYIVSEVGHPLVIIPHLGKIVAALSNFKFITISAIAAGLLIWVIWGWDSKKDTPNDNQVKRKKGKHARREDDKE